MSTPFLCILIAFLLIFVPKVPMAMFILRTTKGYDNKNPRQQQATLEGLGARAVAAHQNGFEAFAPFAAAVVMAHLTVGPQDYRATILAVAFVVARTLYIAAYLANQDYLRSAIWGLGMLCTVGLMCLPWLS